MHPLHRDAPPHTPAGPAAVPVIANRPVCGGNRAGATGFLHEPGLAQPGRQRRFWGAAGNSYASVGLEQWRPDVGL